MAMMKKNLNKEIIQGIAAFQDRDQISWHKIFHFKIFWICLLIILFILTSGYRYSVYSSDSNVVIKGWEKHYLLRSDEEKQVKSSIKKMNIVNKTLKRKLKNFMPRGKYVVIDSVHNRLFLRQGRKTILDAVCSAGSGAVLVDTPSGRKWIFDTPRGEFRILSKKENPVWKKPDWAFIEEGEPIPKDPSKRIEYGVLGEYALYFSNDGYLIHGTLYERLLGRSITHGCIRLGSEDLRILYKATRIGTKIYIY